MEPCEAAAAATGLQCPHIPQRKCTRSPALHSYEYVATPSAHAACPGARLASAGVAQLGQHGEQSASLAAPGAKAMLVVTLWMQEKEN